MAEHLAQVAQYTVKENLTEKQIGQLILYSQQDSLVRQFTSNAKRFQSREAYDKWVKERKVYVVSDIDGNLNGIAWFGRKSIPDKAYEQEFDLEEFGVTFAIRLYGSARGKGIARNFMESTIRLFKESPEYSQTTTRGIWLETSNDNEPAKKLYLRCGFVQVSQPDEKSKIVMIKKDKPLPANQRAWHKPRVFS
jgi:ribosomal protein S18 acetylase RimI-like enzyme